MAELALVPTPVGNLEDMTLRSIRILNEASCIYAEDTRTTRKLLQHFDIHTPLLAYHMHNEHQVLEQVLNTILSNDLTALVTDAGTPGISDPGFLIVRACIEKGIKVTCLPGATAMIPAVVGSGLPCDRFIFEGFLPHKKGRQTKFKELAEESRTIILYESPFRLTKCLESICEFFGEERQVCVVREISKIYEEFQRGTAREVLNYYTQNPPKGEIVVIVDGKPEEKSVKGNKFKS